MKRRHGINVLDRADIEQRAPAFYADSGRGDVSLEYQHVNSRDVAVQLWDAGWMLTEIQQQKSNIADTRDYNKHIMRFAHRDFIQESERVEIVGINSHNRSSSFQLMAGIHIFACLNGMITAERDFGSFAIRHIGDSVPIQVNYALQELSQSAEKIAARIALWKKLEISPEEQDRFAQAIHILTWGDKAHAPVDPHHILRPRRQSEESKFNFRRPAHNLWTTMNVLQENVMKGGIRGTNANGARYTTRPIQAIDRNVNFNQLLWQTTEIMAQKLAA